MATVRSQFARPGHHVGYLRSAISGDRARCLRVRTNGDSSGGVSGSAAIWQRLDSGSAAAPQYLLDRERDGNACEVLVTQRIEQLNKLREATKQLWHLWMRIDLQLVHVILLPALDQLRAHHLHPWQAPTVPKPSSVILRCDER